MHPASNSSAASAAFRTCTSCSGSRTSSIACLDEVEASWGGKGLCLRFQTRIIGGMLCEYLIKYGEEVMILTERIWCGRDSFGTADCEFGVWRVGFEE